MDAAGAAWIGVAGSIIGGFVGSLAAWLFARNSANRDRLVNLYGEWAVACHELLVRANEIGATIECEVQRNPASAYNLEAAIYVSREPGQTYRREYVELFHRLQFAQFKVSTADTETVVFPMLVLTISGEALKIDVMQAAPDITKPLEALIDFNTVLMPHRFGSRGWKKVVQVLTQFRDWLLEGVRRDVADATKPTQRATAAPKSAGRDSRA